MLALPFLMKLRADGLVIDGARAAVGGDELIAERIDQALVAVDGHDVLPRREDHEPFGEAAHPLLALHGAADVGGDGRNVARVTDVERAAGKGVEVHHVHERCRAVDERNVGGRERQLIGQVVSVRHIEAAGRVVDAVLCVSACGGKFVILTVRAPDRREQ